MRPRLGRLSQTIPAVLALALAPTAMGDSFGLKVAASIHSALKKSCASPENVSVKALSMEDGSVALDMNGDTPRIPASVQKLLVSSAALHYLGPAYRFKTRFYYTGRRNGSTILGDLYIKGGGDPGITPEKLWLITDTIRRMGVDKVEGSLVVDNSFFDGDKAPPSWDERRSQRAYDAGIGALSVNFNTVAVRLFPGQALGEPLSVSLMPDPGYFRIVNKTMTAEKKERLAARRSHTDDHWDMIVSGKMPLGADGATLYVNVEDTVAFSALAFMEYLGKAGVIVEGGWHEGKTPENASPLHTHYSEPLSLVVRDLNKYSNNFTAEQIAKTMAAEMDGAPGTYLSALDILSGFLIQNGVALDKISLADASGLSRKNRLTARAVTALLYSSGKRFDIGPDLVSALGIMGVDGSLKDRGNGFPIEYAARAKTGTLTGVFSLAGYLESAQGKRFAFTIFINDGRCSYYSATHTLDQIVSLLRRELKRP